MPKIGRHNVVVNAHCINVTEQLLLRVACTPCNVRLRVTTIQHGTSIQGNKPTFLFFYGCKGQQIIVYSQGGEAREYSQSRYRLSLIMHPTTMGGATCTQTPHNIILSPNQSMTQVLYWYRQAYYAIYIYGG